jgi:hypothetical protein
VHSFDHTALRGTPEYIALLRAVDAFSRASHGLSDEQVIEAVRNTAALMALADPCPRCSVGARPRLAVPYKAQASMLGARVTAFYVCPICSVAWSAQFADPQARAER